MTTTDAAFTLGYNVDPATVALTKLIAKTQRSAKTMTTVVGREVQSLTREMSKLGTIIGPALAASVGAAMFEVANAASAYTDKILQAQEATGISAQEMVGLDFALQAGGSSLDRVRRSLSGFTKRMGDAALKGGEAAEAFEVLGVNVQDAGGMLRPTEQVLKDTIAQLNALESPAEKAALATTLLGSKGGELISALGDGTTAWEHYNNEVVRAGIVMDGDALEASARMDVAMADLELTMQGITQTLGNELIPLVDNFTVGLHYLGAAVSPLVAEFGELWELWEQTPMFQLSEWTKSLVTGAALSNESARESTQAWYESREAMIQAAAAADDVGKVGERLHKTSRETASAVKAETDARKALKKLLEDQANASEQLTDVIEDATADIISAEQGIHDAYWERLQLIQTLEQASEDAFTADLARGEAHERHIRDLNALEVDEATKTNKEKTRLAEEAAAEAQAITEGYLTAASGIASAASNAFAAISEEMAEENRDAALVAFGIAKAAALAQVAIDTALAVSQVNAAWVAAPPVAAALSAAAVATGAVQAGIIAAEQPSFHTGRQGFAASSVSPDEVNARLTKQERVLTGRGVDNIDALNRGMGGGGGAVSVTMMHDHEMFGRQLQTAQQSQGSPVRPAVSGRRRRR